MLPGNNNRTAVCSVDFRKCQSHMQISKPFVCCPKQHRHPSRQLLPIASTSMSSEVKTTTSKVCGMASSKSASAKASGKAPPPQFLEPASHKVPPPRKAPPSIRKKAPPTIRDIPPLKEPQQGVDGPASSIGAASVQSTSSRHQPAAQHSCSSPRACPSSTAAATPPISKRFGPRWE